MKKYISILAVLLMLSLTACSNQGTTPTGPGNTSNTQSERITMRDEGVWPVNEYTEGLPVPSGTGPMRMRFRPTACTSVWAGNSRV